MRKLAQTNGVEDRGSLIAALLAVETANEMDRFLTDLCTPGEIQALAERWRVARLLNAGKYTYREISEKTGASTATVTRVARFLSQESAQGYRLVLDRMKKAANV
jgi:TrpR-related protein YerC/YecD